MAAESQNVKKVWQLVSQFVCWEYCRHFERYAQEERSYAPDLVNFFQDMIVHLTMRNRDDDIAKQEIAAKLLDELSTARTLEQFRIVLRLGECVKSSCPELVPCLNELMSTLLEKLKPFIMQNVSGVCTVEGLTEDMIKYSAIASRLLPSPDLLTICDKWHETEQKSREVSDHELMKRFQRELLAEEVPEILQMIESDTDYLDCVRSHNLHISNSLDHLNVLSEEADAASRLFEPNSEGASQAAPLGSPMESEGLPRTADLLSVTTAVNSAGICAGSTASDSLCKVPLERFTNTESSSCDFINPPHFKKPLRFVRNTYRAPAPHPPPVPHVQPSQSSEAGSSAEFVGNRHIQPPPTCRQLDPPPPVPASRPRRGVTASQPDRREQVAESVKVRLRPLRSRGESSSQQLAHNVASIRRNAPQMSNGVAVRPESSHAATSSRSPQTNRNVTARELPPRSCKKTAPPTKVPLQSASRNKKQIRSAMKCHVVLVDCLKNKCERTIGSKQSESFSFDVDVDHTSNLRERPKKQVPSVVKCQVVLVDCMKDKRERSDDCLQNASLSSDDSLDPTYSPKPSDSYEEVWYRRNGRARKFSFSEITGKKATDTLPDHDNQRRERSPVPQPSTSTRQVQKAASLNVRHAGQVLMESQNQVKRTLPRPKPSRSRPSRSSKQKKQQQQSKLITSHSPAYITLLYKHPSKKERRCVHCLEERGLKKDSSFCCIPCKAPLCPKPCFVSYHSKRNLY